MRALAEPWGESLSSSPCLGRPDVSRTGALTLGLNAEDFSDAVLPVSELQAHVMMSLEPQLERGAREGHSFVLLRLGSGDGDGWPLRLQRLGTYEGLGDGGKVELNLGSGSFKEEVRPNGLRFAVGGMLAECVPARLSGSCWVYRKVSRTRHLWKLEGICLRLS